MSIFTKIGYFFSNEGKKLAQSAAKIAVVIVEFLKTSTADECLNIVAYIVDALTKSGIGTTIVDKIKLVLPNILSLALGVESPNSASAEDLATWTQNVLKAFGVSSDRSKLLAVLAADLTKDIQLHLQEEKAVGKELTFADYFEISQDAYKDYQAHIALPVAA